MKKQIITIIFIGLFLLAIFSPLFNPTTEGLPYSPNDVAGLQSGTTELKKLVNGDYD